MKLLKILCISVIVSSFLATTVDAAKENFDRSKPHMNQKAKDNKNCKKGQTGCTTGKKDRESTRGHGYNSSRSNKESSKQGGGDLTLRKKPGRTKNDPDDDCDGLKTRCNKNAKDHNASRSNTRATDYNSSRSNKNSIKGSKINSKGGDCDDTKKDCPKKKNDKKKKG